VNPKIAPLSAAPMFWLTLGSGCRRIVLRFSAMAFDLERVLRALLFASPGSVTVKEIQAVFTRYHEEAAAPVVAEAEPGGAEAPAAPVSDVPSLVTATQIREAMEAIRAKIEAAGDVCRLQETHQGWRLVTSEDCAEWVRLFRNQPRPLKLSQSALETLAIIAYRQPVVRAEIESIRGVSVDNAISRLLERELIKITGRADLPGRPIQYGTTEQFLEFVGVKSIEELPASDVLSAREIDTWLERTSSVHVSDREVGLDTESGDEEADIAVDRDRGLGAGEGAPRAPWPAEDETGAADRVPPPSPAPDAAPPETSPNASSP
jgi:segregation and condensation protein B